MDIWNNDYFCIHFIKVMKHLKSILLKISTLAIIALVIVIIGFQQGKLFNYSFSGNTIPQNNKKTSISLEDAKYLFPTASAISEDALKQIVVYDKANKTIGYIISSKPYSDSLVGFAGPVPFLIGIDTKNKLVGIKLEKNNESPGYIEYIAKQGFFEKLKNKSVESVINDNIDAVSGASMTTNAIIKALKQKTAEYNKTVIKTKASTLKKKISDGLTILVLIFALLSFFTKYFKKFRLALLISSVLILGFLNGTFISMFLMQGWILNGVPVISQLVLFTIVLIAIILPLISNKSFYCNYLCPFGAAQELTGKITRKKSPFPLNKTFVIKHLRTFIFFIIVLLLILGINFDLTNTEPFSAFIFVSASIAAIILALVFIILSLFFNKPWCNYFCPTGQLLDFFKGSRK